MLCCLAWKALREYRSSILEMVAGKSGKRINVSNTRAMSVRTFWRRVSLNAKDLKQERASDGGT